jgi:murein DD-endopeptidase MepM/ murein hydrolase activator NlpD
MALRLLKILTEEVSEQYWGLAWQDYLTDKEEEMSAEIDRKKIERSTSSDEITNIDANNSFLIKPSSKRGSPFNQQRGVRKDGSIIYHKGIDYTVSVGTNIVLIKPGEVTVASMNADPDGYGAAIYIKHNDGVYTRYGHLSKINVSVGDQLKTGDVIGKTGGAKGSTGAGNSQGAHLHFEYRPSDSPQDPASNDYDNTVFRFANDSDLDEIIINPPPGQSAEVTPEVDPDVSTSNEIMGGSSLSISDISGQSNYGRKGEPLDTRKYFILHHTAGRGSADDVIDILNDRGLGVQFIIDRKGKVYRGLPDGSRGAHVAYFYESAPKDMNNGTAEGVEIIAKNDDDVLEKQCESALKLVKRLGYPLNKIYGHGEVSSNKQPTEGQKCKKYFKNNW